MQNHAKAGQFIEQHHLEDGSRIKTTKDTYNTNKKQLLAITDGIGHDVNNDSNYAVGEQEIVSLLKPNKISRPRLVYTKTKTNTY